MPSDPAPSDAAAIARLREAGVVFLGKTATAESGSRIVTRSAVHGVTRNPWAPDRTPGGSSGGAAAALAAGIGTLAVGTDGAGSIRIPAALCGLTGLKPSFGRFPTVPHTHFMPHSVTGPLARSVDDLALATEVMARADPRDPYAWPIPFDPASAAGPVAGLRVALSFDLGLGLGPDSEVTAALEAAALRLQRAGAVVERADPVWSVPPAQPFEVFWTTGYAAFLDQQDPAAAALMAPLIHEIAERGRSVDVLAYHRAINDRIAITQTAHAFLKRFDALLAPVTPGAAWDIEREAPDGKNPDDWSWCPWPYIFNMTGQPALALPCGRSIEGLPLGLQLAAQLGREETLFRLGSVISPLVWSCEAYGSQLTS
jgi:aspartyl-tRNA(Asn)/glutamyl-tRNA(Gln) amidotransferase subunit A